MGRSCSSPAIGIRGVCGGTYATTGRRVTEHAPGETYSRESPEPVAALYVDSLNGPYRRIPGVECWSGLRAQLSLVAMGSERDARLYDGPHPVVAHPPCGHWGRFRWRCKQPQAWAEAGPVAFRQVRQFGGVLEHPAASALWPVVAAPSPGAFDQWGGYTLQVNQTRWGHPCMKPTWIYICGVARGDLPPLPPDRPPSHCVVRLKTNPIALPELPKRLRHLTPLGLAEWLVQVARLAT